MKMKSHFLWMVWFSLATLSCFAQTWNPLGEGLNNTVDKIILYGADDPDDDDLYVCGHFTNAGGIEEADHIALWDGSKWHAVAPGLNSTVNAIAFNNDILYAGGSFINAGGNPKANYIGKWDGIQWHALGEGFNHRVHALAFDGSDLYAGGFFTATEGNINYIARWDGLQWHSLGEGLNHPVNAIVVKGQDVYVAGWFTDAGGDPDADYIARWDGNKWNALGGGFVDAVLSLTLDGDDLYAGGAAAYSIAKWDGKEWSYLMGKPEKLSLGVSDIAVINQELYVAVFQYGVLHWDGVDWRTLADWVTAGSAVTIAAKNNDIYVGGGFTLNTPNTNNIVRWGQPDLTGTNQASGEEPCTLHVYPNPANDWLNYSLPNSDMDQHSVKLLDFTGKTLIHQIKDYPGLDISHLPAGVYFLQVAHNNEIASAKVVKK